jgi:hypothetical protein
MFPDKPNENKESDPKPDPQATGRTACGGPAPHGEAADADNTDAPSNNQPRKWFQDPGWWLFILTPIAVLVSAMQWQVARDTLKFSNRAYVGVRDVNVWPSKPSTERATLLERNKGQNLTPRPFLEVVFTNSGVTPANNLRAEAHLGVANSPLVSDETPTPPPDTYVNRTVLTRDGVAMVGDFLNRELNSSELEGIRAGKRFLIIWGRITYRDVFRESRITRFCYLYDGQFDNMTPCPSYNGID